MSRELKKTCKDCQYCSVGTHYRCLKVRGGKNDGFEFEQERMKVSASKAACTFFKPYK